MCHPLATMTLSNLNHFQIVFTAEMHVKFTTKWLQHYLPHQKYVATLAKENEMLIFVEFCCFIEKFYHFLTDCNFVMCLPILTIFGA